MKTELKYIELKTGFSDDGPAWIGYVSFSKTGKMLYFNGKAFHGNGHGNCYDVENGELYWITGIKNNGDNRHPVGKGVIHIDEAAIEEYELITGVKIENNKSYKIITVQPTDKECFHQLLNEKL
ncbi:hypothetical protein U0035_14130 [Niabella yanshanensis]|uniref:Mannose-1-phosphate guanylyltransferase n=1 Tax=Niabella yanshanensis TaxID=577386 RepID=A0ABZ0W3Z7_9BACT|nr:hypothetical protein [Niabella yanshanensis]WQD36806.1 hypothetical protein U0035_14130 [Niabella yanshanensis]